MTANGNFNSGDGERGPGWYDVYEGLRRIRKDCGSPVTLCIEPSTSVDARWGLLCVVHIGGRISPIGLCGYGRAYPNGARTLAAACFQAVARAEWFLDELEHMPDHTGPDNTVDGASVS